MSTATSEPSTRRLSLPGPRSAISQRPGPSAAQMTWSRCRGGACSRRRPRAPLRGDAEGLGRFVEGDDEVVVAAAADDLQPAAAARRRVELDVGGGLRRPLPCRRRLVRPLAPLQPSLPWPPSIVSRPPPPIRCRRRGRRRSTLRLLAADQGVVEGRAFEALEAEEPVVAVAEGAVRGEGDPDAAALAARRRRSRRRRCRPCRGRRPCGRSRSRRGPGRRCRGRR